MLTHMKIKNEIINKRQIKTRSLNEEVFNIIIASEINIFSYNENYDYVKKNQGQIYTFYFNDSLKENVNIIPVRIEPVPKFNVPTITEEVNSKIIDLIKLNKAKPNVTCLLTGIINYKILDK